MNWQETKAFITGGASGLGYAVAQRIEAAGGQVAIADLESALATQSLSSESDRCHAVMTDVTDDDSVDQAIKTVIEKFGLINLLVNCAGILASEKMLSKDHTLASSDFEKSIAVNLLGTFRVCRTVAEAMQHNEHSEERGVIINTTSIAAYEGQIGQLAYSASKGGVASMTLPMARELARHNIRVMAIAPGIFATPMLADLPDEIKQVLIDRCVFPHRMGYPHEFAQIVQQIVENPMLNGSVIRLDGGLRMPPK